ncbi:energy-coupling factor ABC transporter ATP-binding protein [Desulfovibrio psychrotolerans]|uniref:Putative ABC transporter ATP-binding protein n=1 Tax=Desulfovibrio psychrotolerans TaxID=415242 RepID=A0A7J0BRG1_9BACT|nr:ABC transporter ATP-binding protein [Desulfovibrio psychrotolerans]GFM35772.1 putative ABC transporter ATP-binding protein [Desulfovibrio psychrotolerans]
MTHTPSAVSACTSSGGQQNPSVLLETLDIAYTYPGASAPALKDASLRIEQGMRIGVMGHNGSGKTTLFHIIMGLVTPHAGEVRFLQRPMRTEKDFRQLRREVGLLFQQSDDQLFCPTVLEDVAFGPLNLGKTPDEARDIARETLRNVGLRNFEQRITHRLSGGEKKMVALAAVLAMQPQVLLLDEPTNDLDPHTREHLIEQLNALPVTRCIISHDWDFLERTCSSFVSLRQGSVHKTDHVPHVHVHIHDGGDTEHRHEDHD